MLLGREIYINLTFTVSINVYLRLTGTFNLLKEYMKYFLSLVIATLTLLMSMASFADAAKFDEANFDAQLKAGKSMVVAVHAPWCSTCRAQAPVLKEVLAQKEFQQVLAVHVDFDSQKDALKKFSVRRQSTLIVFKNGKEVGRSLGDTTALGIESLVQKAL